MGKGDGKYGKDARYGTERGKDLEGRSNNIKRVDEEGRYGNITKEECIRKVN